MLANVSHSGNARGKIDDEKVDSSRHGRPHLPEHFIEEALTPRTPKPRQADNRVRVHPERVGVQSAAPADAAHLVGIDDVEIEAESGGHLFLPLHGQRGWAYDHDPAGALAQQHFLDDQPSFDGLAQAHVISDQQVHPRHRQRSGDRLKLVILDGDPGAKRCLKHCGLRVGDRTPAQGVEERTEGLGLVEAPLADVGQCGRIEDPSACLQFPEHPELFAEAVVLNAGERHQGLTLAHRAGLDVERDGRRGDISDHPVPAADPGQLSEHGQPGRAQCCAQSAPPFNRRTRCAAP